MVHEQIVEFIRSFFSAIQLTRIYPPDHPKLVEGVARAFEALNVLFAEQQEVTLGFVGEEIAFEKEIFFDLSVRFKDMLTELKNKGVEKIVFTQPLSGEEFGGFLQVVSSRDENALHGTLKASGINHVSLGKVSPASGGAPLEIKDQDRFVKDISDSFLNLLSGGQVDMLQLRVTMEEFYEKMRKGNLTFVGAELIRKYDLSTFLHSVNVSLLAMYFVSCLGYSREDGLKVGIAALLHDIGKIAISQQIIKKPGGLTEEEFAQVKSHAQLGCKILFKHIDAIGLLPLVVVYEHHINYGDGGYPKRDFPVMTNVISRIVTLCDFYDALRSRRLYKKQYPPETIYEIMIKESGKKFDPVLLDRFFQEIGVYPVGTVVELSNGFTAIVKEPNRGDIFRPIVEILSPATEKGGTIHLAGRPELQIKGTKEES